ncbi:MAG: hypothetical protein KIT62_05620 [Cyclobacteriaceae bacterium]|nr:hypothetical protein [Cyclobacteriaceae bacterium]
MRTRMDKLSKTGGIFFAVGLMALGTEHFIFQDFITGRAPKWPEPIPGQQAWAYVSGVLFIIISVMILIQRNARLASVIFAALVFMWALLRHIPVVAADTFLSGAWTSAGKALVFIGGALAVAATFPKESSLKNAQILKFINLEREFIVTGRICLGFFLIITGIQHFLFVEFVASLIPRWFPGDAVFWTYFAGVMLIAGGVGLFIPGTARLAAFLSGVMIFSWFWIVHLPRFMVSVSDKIALFEALAFSGVAFVLMRFPDSKKSAP